MPITHASSSCLGAGYNFKNFDSLIVLWAIFVKTLNYQLEWTDSSVGRNLCKYPIFTPPLTNKSRLAGFEFHNFHTTFKLLLYNYDKIKTYRSVPILVFFKFSTLNWLAHVERGEKRPGLLSASAQNWLKTLNKQFAMHVE